MKVTEVLEEYKPIKIPFKKLKKYKVPLDDNERKECFKRKATWRDIVHGKRPAVWKSKLPDGKIVYITNTHRAFNTAPTLKGAIKRFHVFIKGTA